MISPAKINMNNNENFAHINKIATNDINFATINTINKSIKRNELKLLVDTDAEQMLLN